MQRPSPPPQPASSLRGSHLSSCSLGLPVERRESERSHFPAQPLQHAEMAMRSTTPGSRSSPLPALAPPPPPLASAARCLRYPQLHQAGCKIVPLQAGGTRKASPLVPCAPGGSFVWAAEQPRTHRARSAGEQGEELHGGRQENQSVGTSVALPWKHSFRKDASNTSVSSVSAPGERDSPSSFLSLSHALAPGSVEAASIAATQLPAALCRTGLTTNLVSGFSFDQIKFSRTPSEGFKHPPFPKRKWPKIRSHDPPYHVNGVAGKKQYFSQLREHKSIRKDYLLITPVSPLENTRCVEAHFRLLAVNTTLQHTHTPLRRQETAIPVGVVIAVFVFDNQLHWKMPAPVLSVQCRKWMITPVAGVFCLNNI